MDAVRRDHLHVLLEQVLALPPGERAAFVDRACAADPDLHRELTALLERVDRTTDNVPFRTSDGNRNHDLAGQTVTHYRIQEKLGSGGMGVVYKAIDTKLRRTVALKFLPAYLSTEEQAKARFTHEARTASALDHPNIGTIHEISETEDGRPFIAMAYYPGETLAEKITRGPLPVEEALDYAAQIARGLDRAHAAGIVHRDVKPANVIVVPNQGGERGRVKLVDFGIAKVVEVSLTQVGSTMGTVAYTSPEQAHGVGVDHRTDLWSLGVVLYEMLAGERPFKGEYEQALIYSVLNEEPSPLASLRKEVPEGVPRVVDRLLKKDPAARYQSAEEVAVALDALGAGGSEVRVLPGVASILRRGLGRRWLAIGVTALLMLVIGGLAVLGPFGAETVSEEDVLEKTIAVLPFSVQGDEEVVHLENGMVHLLHNTLDGMGDLRSIDPYALLNHIGEARQPITDPQRAAEVVAEFGASRFVLGSVVRLGRQIRFSATLYDAVGHFRNRVEATADDEEGLPAAVDTLAVQLIADEIDAPLQKLVPAAVRTTKSIPALRAYLRSEYLGRQGRPTEASAAIREAVDHDSTFALAWTRLLLSRLETQAAAYVKKYGYKLPERERRLAAAILDESSSFEAKLQQYREVVDAYPDFARARFIYADYLFHSGSFYGHPASEARPQLERALRYDPNNAEIIFHLPVLAMKAREFDVLDSLLVRYEKELKGMWGQYRYFRLVNTLSRGDEEEFEAFEAGLGSEGIFHLARVSCELAVFLEDLPAAQRVIDLVKRPTAPEDPHGIHHHLDFIYATARGQLRRADSLRIAHFEEQPWNLLNQVQASVSRRYPISDEQLRGLRDQVARWDTLHPRMVTWFGSDYFAGQYAEMKTYLTGLISYRLGDAAAFERAADGLRELALQNEHGHLGYRMERILAALALWRDGRTARALAALDDAVRAHYNLENDYYPVALLRVYVRAEILFSEGRYAEALLRYAALYDNGLAIPDGLVYLGPSYLRQAEIYERLGETEKAIDFYRRLIKLWEDCDPELRPTLDEAQRRLNRLLEGTIPEPGQDAIDPRPITFLTPTVLSE